MGKIYVGIEFGSTRIKAVAINGEGKALCGGGYAWENKLDGGYWSYSLNEVKKGLQTCYAELSEAYRKKFGERITEIDGMGISAMMHGYLAFDGGYNLLTPFRTWRNTNTAVAAFELSRELNFNMPMRWSASHYYQAVLDGEKHVENTEHLHTLASYVHYLLTGKNVIGIGDGSGMFPVRDGDYDKRKIQKYNELLRGRGVNKDLHKLLPEVLLAGDYAGTLTKEGAYLLDPSGNLKEGAKFCPPEGDAGTGMVATNAVRENTGNVSAGTSAFAMAVLQKPLENVYPEIDIVSTPDGKDVAMVHVNNCTSEINMWAELFGEAAKLCGASVDAGKFMSALFRASLSSDGECGGFMGYNFLSGEPIAGVEKGTPLVFRTPGGKPTLANFMQTQIYSAVASLAMGMEILKKENVTLREMCGHGGFFKTDFVGANAMSAAVSSPVVVMKNAGEGGAWGIALLALYASAGKGSLVDFLQNVFEGADKVTVTATEEEKQKFERFMRTYKENLKLEMPTV